MFKKSVFQQSDFFFNTVALTLYLDVRLSSLSGKDFVGSDTQKQMKLVPGTMPVKS